jgi:ATP-dependent protease ClpP protease subunit
MPQPVNKYFNVATHQKEDVAEIYIYGYIGQQSNPYCEEDDTEELTDMAILNALNELEHYARINIHINSPGGSIYHGDAIISAIARCSSEVHVYNDGMCASMAAQIWMSCTNRHMGKNAKLMVHSSITSVYGNSHTLRTEANNLDVFDASFIANMAEACGISEEEVKSQYFDGEDHWLSAKDCVNLGLIQQAEDYAVQIPDNVDRMNYGDVVRFYATSNNVQSKRGNVLQRAVQGFQAMLGASKPLPPTTMNLASNLADEAITEQSTININMNIDELKNAVSKGDISAAQLTEYVASLGYNVEKQAAPPDPAIAALTSKVDSIVAALEKIGAAPGAAQTRVAANGDEEKQVDAYAQYQNKMAELALSGDKVKFDN